MAKSTDERFAISEEFDMSPPASSSKLASEHDSDALEAEANSTSEQETEQEDSIGRLDDGMDAEGFSGPKIVKPLTPEALAAFQAAQEKAGVIYISRIPPGMQPTKVRHLMSQYGEVGRVYLQKEGTTISFLTEPKLNLSQTQNVLICVANTQPPRNHTTPKAGSNSKTKRLPDLWRKC